MTVDDPDLERLGGDLVAGHSDPQPRDLVDSHDRHPDRMGLASAVGPGHDIGYEQLFEPLKIAALSRLDKAFDHRASLLLAHLETLAALDVIAGAPVQLPSPGLGDVQNLGDLAMAEPECLPQHEGRALRRGQPLQQ